MTEADRTKIQEGINSALQGGFRLYACEDKGEYKIIAAPDIDNAQSMVDAGTKLVFVGQLIGGISNYGTLGPINAQTLFMEKMKRRFGR